MYLFRTFSLLLLPLLLFETTGHAQSLELQEFFRQGVLGAQILGTGMVVEDIDQDGNVELITAGKGNGNPFYAVWEWNEDTKSLEYAYASNRFNHTINYFTVKDFQDGLGPLIVLGMASGEIFLVDFNTQRIIQKIKVSESGVSQISFGDPDNDGEEEMLVTNSYTFQIYDIRSFQKEFEFSPSHLSGAAPIKIEIANLDHDEYWELATNQGDVYQLNEQRLTHQWWDKNIGYRTVFADLDHDGMDEIIRPENDDRIDIYESKFAQPRWTIDVKTTTFIEFQVWDYNQDGIDEILVAPQNYYNQRLFCIDITQNEILWSIDMPERLYNVILADINQDQHLEILTANSHGNSLDEERLRVFNLETQDPLWASPQFLQSQLPYTAGDLDNDGNLEIVVGLGQKDPFILIYDASTFQIEQIIDHDFMQQHDIEVVESALIGDWNGDGKNELFLGASSYHYDPKPSLFIFDGQSLNLISNFSYERRAGFGTLALVNYNGDDRKEVAVGISRWQSDYKPQVLIIDPQNGTIMDQSPDVLDAWYVTSLMAFDQDNDGKDEILFTISDNFLYSIRGFERREMPEGIKIGIGHLADLRSGHGPELLFHGYRGVIKDPPDPDAIHYIMAYNPYTLATRTLYTFPTDIFPHSLRTGDFDGDSYPELVFTHTSTNLNIFDPRSHSIEWNTPNFSTNVGYGDRLLVQDLDQDGTLEILVGSGHLLLGFSSDSTAVSTQELLSDGNCKVFPNPSSGQIEISFEGNLQVADELVLMDPLGRVHGRKVIRSSTQQLGWDVSSLSPGVYYLTMGSSSGNIGQQKLLIHP